MIGIPLGLLYANMGEWVIHKYVLHAMGKNKANKPFFGFHWYEHHKNAREHAQYDPTYEKPPLTEWNAQSKELLGLVGLAAVHAPLLPVAPFFTLTVWYSTVNYYRVHKKSHLDPEWGKKHLPWHVDHHLGPDQNQNWCVTKPWFDIVMGTRKPYIGTEKHAADEKRRAARKLKLDTVAAAG